MTPERLIELQGEAARLRAALIEVELAVRNAKLELSPVKVGTVVRVTRRKARPFDAIVRKVDVSRDWPSQPWIWVSQKKKDGEWAKAEFQVFSDYEIIPRGDE